MINVFRFNWPLYAVALLTFGVGGLCLWWVPGWWTPWAVGGLVVAAAWFAGSLLASLWIYDLSPIARGAWLESAPTGTRSVAIFHAGHDEASGHARALLTEARIGVYDFFDPTMPVAGSLERARARATSGAEPVACNALPLATESIDLALLVFALHELRQAEARAAFLGEVRRVLRQGGRLVVVEHLRDLYNLLAYGPGVLHFLPERDFRRAFTDGGLEVVAERHFTPFVRCYALERPSVRVGGIEG